MPESNDISISLQEQVIKAIESSTPLFIHGGKSKFFYGYPVEGEPLDISHHTGVISYEPSELCITVRAGTKLSDIEELLAENNQILPFEPPYYSKHATIGGAIATGIAGPRRAYTGSVRDAILGVQIINGEGEIANFGGQVMKNVAGYDLSRLMVRSQGTLGVILNVSLRLLPKPETNITITFDATQKEALEYFKALRLKQLPITATAWYDNQAFLRLSGSEPILKSCKDDLNGNQLNDADDFWAKIRDHHHLFFKQDDKPLWRISLPPSTDEITQLGDDPLIEWGGAQRWFFSNAPANIIQSVIRAENGHATLFKTNAQGASHFPLLEENLLALHKSVKRKMDPHGIFNPNRIYQGL